MQTDNEPSRETDSVPTGDPSIRERDPVHTTEPGPEGQEVLREMRHTAQSERERIRSEAKGRPATRGELDEFMVATTGAIM